MPKTKEWNNIGVNEIFPGYVFLSSDLSLFIIIFFMELEINIHTNKSNKKNA